MKLDHFPTPYTKSDSKWMDKRPKCEIGIHQNPRGEHRQQPLWYRPQQHFHDTSPKARETKEKMNLWDFIKIKSFCPAKETVKKLRGSTQNGRRYLQMMLQIINNFYKELKLNTRETHKAINKWAEDMNTHFSNEDIQMANRHMKKCSKLWAIREIQIKNHTEIPPYTS